jgi:hypothetical protein
MASESSALHTHIAYSNVNSTDNALQIGWHLPPNAAADDPSNREAKFALVVRHADSVI